MAPTLIGWVVFAADLDAREMRGARAACRRSRSTPPCSLKSDGRWSEAAGSMSALSGDVGGARREPRRQRRGVRDDASAATDSIALAKPLPTFSDGERAILLLAYPKAAGARRRAQAAARACRHDAARPAPGRASRPGGRPAGSPSRSPGSTRPPGGSRRASMSRSGCAAATSWRGSPPASTRWSARSPSASSASPSSPSTTC